MAGRARARRWPPPRRRSAHRRRWNGPFDAGYAAALGKRLITLPPPEHDHALKEVDRAALAVARKPEQVAERSSATRSQLWRRSRARQRLFGRPERGVGAGVAPA